MTGGPLGTSTKYRAPFLQVTGPNDEDMLKTWGSRLIGVKLIDRASDVSDEAIFMFTRKPPYMPLPNDGTPFRVRLGWSNTDVVLVGYYTFQRTHIFGSPKRGQQLHLICRSANLVEHFKAVDSQHFDKEGGHYTLGDVFQSIFRSTGQTVDVHPDIAKLEIPGGYLLRWNQSAIDFASELADANGAHVKIQGNKVLILKDYSKQSVSGKDLPRITIKYNDNYEFDVELEPRFEYRKVTASYLNTDEGRLESAEKTEGQGKDGDVLPHTYSSKDQAERAAAAVAAAWAANSGTGLFTSYGRPEAVADAPVKCTGFGPEIDGAAWISTIVTHDVNPEVGWVTTVETSIDP
ncbi:hypothetical protein R1A27_03450 [Methylobacterium sp. NMS12]|uniref:phage late control D family protein n=1 Tax=Methylobacterium sp. NMS12 TaxID=3079766 RepID=UPI003F883A73